MSLTERRALAKFAVFSTACLSWIVPDPVIGIANGLLGGALNGPAGRWAYVVSGLLLLLGITRLALWLEGESLAALGLRFDSRRLRESTASRTMRPSADGTSPAVAFAAEAPTL